MKLFLLTPEKIEIGIIGGAGYLAGELVRILSNHPNVEIKYVQSKSQHFIEEELNEFNLLDVFKITRNGEIQFHFYQFFNWPVRRFKHDFDFNIWKFVTEFF